MAMQDKDPCCSEEGMMPEGQQMGGSQWQEMGDSARRGGSEMRGVATQVTQAAKRQISQAAEQVRSLASQRLDEGKRWTAEELTHAAHAVRSAAQKLREEQDEQMASYAETLAQWAEEGANYVREMRLDEVAQETRSLVRRNPEWVLGGLFIAGLALGRFLKASNLSPQMAGSYGQDAPEGWAPESGQSQPERHSPPYSPAHEPSSVTGVSTI